jgi:hypothetical protein
LPPRETIYKYGLEKYDELNKPPVYITPEPADYDSITNFILTSGLLNIDMNYKKPVPINGLMIDKIGGGGYGYTIETSDGKIGLPIFDSPNYIIPKVLLNFDALYRRIIARYQIKNER